MKLPYFKLTDALNEARENFSYGSNSEKLSSVAKLLGKTVANVGMLATEAGVEVIKNAPEIIGQAAEKNLEKNRHIMSSDQIEKANEIIEKGKEAKTNRQQKD